MKVELRGVLVLSLLCLLSAQAVVGGEEGSKRIVTTAAQLVEALQDPAVDRVDVASLLQLDSTAPVVVNRDVLIVGTTNESGLDLAHGSVGLVSARFVPTQWGRCERNAATQRDKARTFFTL